MSIVFRQSKYGKVQVLHKYTRINLSHMSIMYINRLWMDFPFKKKNITKSYNIFLL